MNSFFQGFASDATARARRLLAPPPRLRRKARRAWKKAWAKGERERFFVVHCIHDEIVVQVNHSILQRRLRAMQDATMRAHVPNVSIPTEVSMHWFNRKAAP
jgi:hypothetical protein